MKENLLQITIELDDDDQQQQQQQHPEGTFSIGIVWKILKRNKKKENETGNCKIQLMLSPSWVSSFLLLFILLLPAFQ